MTMPYYASAEQVMRDRSEYARKGISRGRSVAVVTYADGVLFIAENPSSTLHKVSELYDRIGFAAVGRYSEFESLRVAGIRLAAMIRGNLGAAMQGLAVVPLFAGFDLDAASGSSPGRIFSYDITGGNYEERGYAAVGSGSLFAKNSLKKTWRSGLSADDAVRTVVESLYDAADDDSATGGPDPVRRLYPIVYRVDSEGAVRLTDAEVAAVADGIVTDRAEADRTNMQREG